MSDLVGRTAVVTLAPTTSALGTKPMITGATVEAEGGRHLWLFVTTSAAPLFIIGTESKSLV
jgi:hypothetical protein